MLPGLTKRVLAITLTTGCYAQHDDKPAASGELARPVESGAAVPGTFSCNIGDMLDRRRGDLRSRLTG